MQPHREVPRRAVLVPQDFDPLIALGHAEEVALDVGLALPRQGVHTQRDTHSALSFQELFVIFFTGSNPAVAQSQREEATADHRDTDCRRKMDG